MELTDLINIDPNEVEEFLLESNELYHELCEDRTNAKRAVSKQKLEISVLEGHIHKKMMENPAKFNLKKTTDTATTFAMSRNANLTDAKLKLIDLEKEFDCSWANINLFDSKREILMNMWKQTNYAMSQEGRNSSTSFSDRREARKLETK